jgi:hypothetical protein
VAQEPWYRGVPTVEAKLQVSEDASHRIAWRRGRFVLLDHPDPSGEMALAALGGELCPCFELREAWRTADFDTAWQSTGWFFDPADVLREYRLHRERMRNLRLRVPGNTSPGGIQLARPGGRSWFSTTRGTRVSDVEAIHGELVRRLRERLFGSLPTPFLERLAFGMVVRGLRASESVSGMARIRLREFVLDAVVRCVRAWGPTKQRQLPVDIELWLTNRVAPQLVGLVEPHLGYVEAVLPSRWLVAVHARGLAVVDDCFVLDATLDHATGGRVEAVHFERTSPAGWTPVQRTMQVRRTRTTWHLT